MPGQTQPTATAQQSEFATMPTMAIQQAMEAWRVRQAPPDADVEDTGPLDGLWGPQTAGALRAYVDYAHPQREIMVIADRRDQFVEVSAVIAYEIWSLQRVYNQLLTGALEPLRGTPRYPQPVTDQIAAPPAASAGNGEGVTLGPAVPRQAGMSTLAKVSIGLVVAGGLTAAGIWWWRRRR